MHEAENITAGTVVLLRVYIDLSFLAVGSSYCMALKLLHSLSPPASLFGFKLLGFMNSSYIKYKRESDQRPSDHVVDCEVSVSLLCTSYILIVLSVSYTLSG